MALFLLGVGVGVALVGVVIGARRLYAAYRESVSG